MGQRHKDIREHVSMAQRAQTFEEFESLTSSSEFLRQNPVSPRMVDSQFSGRLGYRRFYLVAHSALRQA